MVCVTSIPSKQQDHLMSTAKKVMKKYNIMQKQKKQFSLLRSSLPCKQHCSDLQTVLQAIQHIRNLQHILQG